jgi:hypothetical protein
MAEEKWYQKGLVQAAMVTGAGAVLVAIVGALLNRQTPSEAYKTIEPKSASVTVTGATDAQHLVRGFSAESSAARNTLRNSLSHMSAAESGLKIDLIPPGSFGFAHPSLFRHTDFEVERFPTGRLYFEIQKFAQKQVFAIVFVNADTRRQITLENKVTRSATLYSDMWQEAPYAVRVDTASCRGGNRIVSLDDGSSVTAVDCDPVGFK